MSTPIQITDTEMAGNVKNVYSQYRTKLFPIATPLIAQIQKEGPNGPKSMTWGGSGVFFDTVVNPPLNWTASASGWLPRSHAAREVQGFTNVARMYVRRTVDGLALNGTQSRQAAYISLRAKVLDEIDGAYQLGLAEMLHGDGRGVKGIVTGSPVGSPVTGFDVISPYGYTGAGQGGLWIYPGMAIGFRDSTGATFRGRSVVQTVTNSGDTASVVISPGVSGVVATDLIVAVTDNDDAFNAYSNGLGNLTNRGGSFNTLHNINAGAAGLQRWNTTRLVAGADFTETTATEMIVWDLAARIGARCGVDPSTNPDQFLCLTTKGIERHVIESMIGQRTIAATANGKLKLNGGYFATNVSGMPLITDPWCPRGTLYIIHIPSLAWVDARDWAPVQFEDSPKWRPVQDRDAWETSYAMYFNVLTLMRCAHGHITGFADTTAYTPVM